MFLGSILSMPISSAWRTELTITWVALDALNPIASIFEELNPFNKNPIKTIDGLADDSRHPGTQINRIPITQLFWQLQKAYIE